MADIEPVKLDRVSPDLVEHAGAALRLSGRADWWSDYSDDHNVRAAGRSQASGSLSILNRLAVRSEEGRLVASAIYSQTAPKEMSRPAWWRDKVVLASPDVTSADQTQQNKAVGRIRRENERTDHPAARIAVALDDARSARQELARGGWYVEDSSGWSESGRNWEPHSAQESRTVREEALEAHRRARPETPAAVAVVRYTPNQADRDAARRTTRADTSQDQPRRETTQAAMLTL